MPVVDVGYSLRQAARELPASGAMLPFFDETGVKVVEKVKLKMPANLSSDLIGQRNWMRWVEQAFMNAYKGYSIINKRKEKKRKEKKRKEKKRN